MHSRTSSESLPDSHACSLTGQVLCLELVQQDGDVRLISGSDDQIIMVSTLVTLDLNSWIWPWRR